MSLEPESDVSGWQLDLEGIQLGGWQQRLANYSKKRLSGTDNVKLKSLIKLELKGVLFNDILLFLDKQGNNKEVIKCVKLLFIIIS